jgi:hypothetical protein
MVVFHIFMIPGISTGDSNPIYNVPMLGTHKPWDIKGFQP